MNNNLKENFNDNNKIIDDNEKLEIKLNSQDCIDNRLGGDIMYAFTFLGRIIFTLYSFHGLFFIYNFIIQYIILVPGILYDIESTAVQFTLGLIYLIFSVCTSDILVIPSFEFFSFPFLYYRNPFAHFQSFYYIFEDKEFNIEEKVRKNNNYTNGILLFVEVLYALGYCLGLGSITVKVKDYIKIIVLVLIYLYYLIIFFNYILISFFFIYKSFADSKKRYDEEIIKAKNPNPQNKENNEIKQNDIVKNSQDQNNQNVNHKKCYSCGECWEIIKGAFDFEKFFENRKPIPEINLFSYVVEPLLLKNYELKNMDKKDTSFEEVFLVIKNFIKIPLLLFSLVLAIILTVKGSKDIPSIICFCIVFLIMSAVSIVVHFQFCFRNKKTFGYFWSPKITFKKKLKNPKLVSTIRFICFSITLITSSVLFISFFLVSESDDIEDFPEFSPSDKTINKSLLLPNICTSYVHGIPIYLYLPFINDAYYYNDNPKNAPYFFSSLRIPKYRKLFFDDSYEITIKGNLIKKNTPESVKMIQYNVKSSKDEVTILSIKGTSNKRDIYIDFQLYFPSILLNILSTFSIFGQQKETISFKFIEYSLSIPYRLFSQYLIIDEYLNDLKKAYIDNKNSFYKNVVIVGHSLGGGLCKLLGRLVKQQAISLSGPGVNAFHHLWGYEGQSENFEISAIDLVPDMDLVPRVEVSGGTIYRIVCKEGPLDCHSKALSLCEILIMCRNPNYEDYCRKMANLNDGQINSILEGSELN